MVTLPSGYVWIERPRCRGFAHEELRAWVEEALARSTLHRDAADRAERTLHGRGPVYVASVAGRARAVRHYLRGGLPAQALHDRFLRLGEPRPLRELHASEWARRAGISTPKVVAGALYPSGIFYRADLVTDYVPESETLADVVFRAGDPTQRREALRAAGNLITAMASIGLKHSDLNARNILLVSGADGLDALPVDLDRCSVTMPPRPVAPGPMVERLVRSLEKIARAEAPEGWSLPPNDFELLRGVTTPSRDAR